MWCVVPAIAPNPPVSRSPRERRGLTRWMSIRFGTGLCLPFNKQTCACAADRARPGRMSPERRHAWSAIRNLLGNDDGIRNGGAGVRG